MNRFFLILETPKLKYEGEKNRKQHTLFRFYFTVFKMTDSSDLMVKIQEKWTNRKRNGEGEGEERNTLRKIKKKCADIRLIMIRITFKANFMSYYYFIRLVSLLIKYHQENKGLYYS